MTPDDCPAPYRHLIVEGRGRLAGGEVRRYALTRCVTPHVLRDVGAETLRDWLARDFRAAVERDPAATGIVFDPPVELAELVRRPNGCVERVPFVP